MDQSRYIPALRFHWLTPVYDPLLRWGMRESLFKSRLIEQADLRPGQRVLDLGCGTGTLTVMLKQSAPQAEIVGLDGDRDVLSIAESKAAQAGLQIQWDYGMAYRLPYEDQSFDAVLSSLVVHHLTRSDKVRAFREVRRVLKPGGAFQIVDFGSPFNGWTRLQAAVMMNLEEAFDNFPRTNCSASAGSRLREPKPGRPHGHDLRTHLVLQSAERQSWASTEKCKCMTQKIVR
jgi:ubiquinone/menaquinone biosynthesis C-methylase UbiE